MRLILKKLPLFINKKAYIYMNRYIKIIVRDAKDFGILEIRNELMQYYFDELKKVKLLI